MIGNKVKITVIHSGIRLQLIGPAFIIKYRENKGRQISNYLLKSMEILPWHLGVSDPSLNTKLAISLGIEVNRNKLTHQ